jgi:microcin C transport system permease protein
MIPTLIGISVLVFTLTQVVPGGPVEQFMNKLKFGGSGDTGRASAEITEELRAELNKLYGFDQPIHIRYFKWVGNLLKGNLGDSYEYKEPVSSVIMQKLPVSLTFGIFSFFLVYLISIPLGIFKAIKDGSTFDTASSLLLIVTYSIPPFAFAIVLIVLFCGGSFLDWFPLQGLRSDEWEEFTSFEKVKDYLHHIVLPLFAYVIGQFAVTSMMMKNSFLEQISQDYVRTAKAKGLSQPKIYFKHVLRNALVPIATEIGDFLTLFLSGSILIEQIFGLDGIGMLNYQSILTRDYPVVLAIIMIVALARMLGSLLSDVLYVVLDPKVSFE